MERLRGELAKGTRQDVVLFSDEVDIHLNPKAGLDWTPPKVRKVQVTPGQNKKRYIAGAYNPKSETLTFVQGERKNSDLCISLLHTLVKRYRGFATTHPVLDNYIIHRSKKTLAAVEAPEGKVKLHWLPPYSPEYNPIERVWWDLHAGITRNHRCPDIDALMGKSAQYLEAFSGRGGRHVSLVRKVA